MILDVEVTEVLVLVGTCVTLVQLPMCSETKVKTEVNPVMVIHARFSKFWGERS